MPQALVSLGAWTKAEYLIRRGGVNVKALMIVGQRETDAEIYYEYAVGAAYLLIGWFVLFRRGNAQKAQHFFCLCLASFTLFTFHYTGKLNNFDKVMYWGNVAAGLFAPTIFLHFCLAFPEPRHWLRRGRAVVLYLPALGLLAVFLGIASGNLRIAVPLVELRWILDRLWLALLTLAYLAGGAVLSLQHRKADDPIMRQQLKWLRNGTLLGIVPFAVFNVGAVSPGSRSRRPHEAGGAFAGPDPADLGLCHAALPADGRGHHLPAGLRLHSGHHRGAGHFLWIDLLGWQVRRFEPQRGAGC